MTLTRRDVLVVIPAFNEEDSLAHVLHDVRSAGFDLVVVDDGSSDATSGVGRSIGEKVVSLPINLGVGGALRTGFQYARRRGYKAVVQVDADGQHDPSHIQNLIDAANASGAHMVIGSRFQTTETSMTVGVVRRQVMRVLAKSASIAGRTEITDATSGFRLIREPLLAELSMSLATNYLGDTYEAIVVSGRAGYIITEVPAPIRNRAIGKSSSSAFQSMKFTIKGLGVWILRLHTRIRTLSDNDERTA